VSVVLLIFGVVLGCCGLGLTGLGVSMVGTGSVGPGGLGLAVGLLTSYGAYLLVRAAVRTRRELKGHPPSPTERAERRGAVRSIVGFTLAAAVASVFLPIPGFERVIVVIVLVLVVPLHLAAEFEPPKNKRHR
jgi:hypothetical protein